MGLFLGSVSLMEQFSFKINYRYSSPKFQSRKSSLLPSGGRASGCLQGSPLSQMGFGASSVLQGMFAKQSPSHSVSSDKVSDGSSGGGRSPALLWFVILLSCLSWK